MLDYATALCTLYTVSALEILLLTYLLLLNVRFCL